MENHESPRPRVRSRNARASKVAALQRKSVL
jgi:hypothetical protein